MKSYKKFYKFYFKTLNSIQGFNEINQEEKKKLLEGGSLERYQMELILQKNYIGSCLKKKFNLHFENAFCSIWFDFANGCFASDKEQMSKINAMISEIKKEGKAKKIYVFFIGILNHWLTVIYDNDNIYILDSFQDSYEGLSLTTEDQINEYIEEKSKINHEKYKEKKLTAYQKKIFHDLITDMQSLIVRLRQLFFSNISIYEIVLEHNIKLTLVSFEAAFGCSVEDIRLKCSSDPFSFLFVLYNWLLTEYHPKILQENIYDVIQEIKKNGLKISPELGKKINGFCSVNQSLIKENITAIDESDIKNLIHDFSTLCKKITEIKDFF